MSELIQIMLKQMHKEKEIINTFYFFIFYGKIKKIKKKMTQFQHKTSED